MTQDEKQIAIAEACGWTEIEPCTCHNGQVRGFQPIRGAHKKHTPDYFNDLNAMHEAEKVLTRDQQVQFSVELGKLTTSHLPASRSAWVDFTIAHATAAQRARAFLETLGLWEEIL